MIPNPYNWYIYICLFGNMFPKSFNKVPECFTIVLIKEVEKYPVIWETLSSTADIRNDRLQAYESIADYINSLSKIELHLTSDSIQDKWRNVRVAYRNSYSKILSNLPNGTFSEDNQANLNEIHIASKYKYKNELYFLAKQMVAKDTSTLFEYEKDNVNSYDFEYPLECSTDDLSKETNNTSIFPEIKSEIFDEHDILNSRKRKLSGDKSLNNNGEIEILSDVIQRRVCRPTLMSPPSRSPLASSDHSNDACTSNGATSKNAQTLSNRTQINHNIRLINNVPVSMNNSRKKKRHAFQSMDNLEDQLGEISDSIGDINTSLRSLSDMHNSSNIQSSAQTNINHNNPSSINKCQSHNNTNICNSNKDSDHNVRVHSFFKYISDTVSTFPEKDILDIMNSVYNIVFTKEMELLNS